MMKASNIHIGDEMLIKKGKGTEPSRIKRLHEVCAVRPGPHVHIVHEVGALCVGFRQFVNARPNRNR